MKKPNVILLFSDQHRADAVGYEHHPDVLTPNLDRLAAEGSSFSRAYCQDAVCVPSRCSLFTGLYPRTLGCLDNGDRTPVMDRVVPLQKMFQANGYFTAAFGKRHLVQACDDGWDVKKSHLAEEHDPEHYMKWVKEQGFGKEFARDWAAEWGNAHPEGPEGCDEFTVASMCARPSLLPASMTAEAYTKNETIAMLEQCDGNDKPFFIFSSFLRPHQPYTPPQSYYDRFDRSHWGKGMVAGDGMARPYAFDQPLEDLPPGLQKYRSKAGTPWNNLGGHEDEQVFRDAMAAYYAGILEIDDCIGEIMDALDKLGLKENTIVIYTSDHGEFAGCHGMMEKSAANHNVYEDCLRVPFVISWPGTIRPQSSETDLVELLDIYPTLMSLCDCQRPSTEFPLAGMDISDCLTQGTPIDREFTISENWSQASVVTRDYKLGVWLDNQKNPDGNWQDFGDMLFERATDPSEETNIINSPNVTDTKNRLYNCFEQWNSQVPADGKNAVLGKSVV